MSVITETEEWVIISGTIVADSAYQYLIIGNFFSELIYDTTNVGTNPYNRVYYYVEDVSVYNPGHTEITEEVSSYRLHYNAQNKQVSVFYQGSFDESIERLEVYSVTGQHISTLYSLNSNHVIIDCSTYVPGVYFVRSLDSNNRYEQLKFIVQ